MNSERLFTLFEGINDDEIANAEKYHGRLITYRMKKRIALACAAILLVLAVGIPLSDHLLGNYVSYPLGIRVVRAAYPESRYSDMNINHFGNSRDHSDWWMEYRDKVVPSIDLQNNLSDYYLSIMENTLVSQNDNTVCSPLNMYIALSMLAEVTDGNTRQQILDALCVDDIDQLRNNSSILWEANYVDTPLLTSNLANSIWLNDNIRYHDNSLDVLANTYHASSFIGNPGSEKMETAMKQWMSENTRGLLDENISNIELDPEMVLTLISTIYYKAGWGSEFIESENTEEVFHGCITDTNVIMMHKNMICDVYQSDTFSSLGLPLTDSGSMYFFLPDEGIDVNTLVFNPEILDVVSRYKKWGDHLYTPLVHLSIPKFCIIRDTNLLETLPAMGISDALNPMASDFTPLTSYTENIYLKKAEHVARVEVDEQGVTGVAYTIMGTGQGGEPIIDGEMYFNLDRPFLFIITGNDGSILFSGIVRNI